MSFKRDGDDSGLLKNLQHKRVTDILGDHIPDDEAKLLSNGRLTCTVCLRRPIFDTIQMLSLHRRGKKHLYELSQYLQYKRDLEYKKAKQTQKSFLKTEQISIEPDTSSSSLLSYKRNHTKKKSCSALMCKNLALDVTESSERIKTSLNPPTIISLSANSQVRHYLKSLSRKTPLQKTVNRLQESYNGKMVSQCSTKSETKSEHNKSLSRKTPLQKTVNRLQESYNGEIVSQSSTKSETKSEHNKKAENTSFSGGKDVNYKVNLLESGWIQDLNGKWVKDPNVEFDSDEEEPPSFP